MQFVADLHIHSHFSRATSQDLTFEHLSKWAQLKGVQVVGTGDIAHPGWLQEMKQKLEPAEEGLFRLKAEYARPVQAEVFAACQSPVRFMLAGEISSIYKKNDQVRKIHNIIFAPTFAAVEKIQAALEKIGNIRADGRPILGLDSRNLLELILEIDPQNALIPAHIWTPWFALLGSKSGFDSVVECFDDLTPHIFALETGLSSDPPMNWRVSALDGYTLVSNSDAHSPQKLAREATLFDTELSYPAIFAALRSGIGFGGTLEFFPEEGKYHLDGHRKCQVRWEPETTLSHNGLCPVCGKPVTVGVMHRVAALADRPAGVKPARTHPFHSLIPLPEILGEVYSSGAASKKVIQSYETLLTHLGSELAILRSLPLAEIERVGGALLAEGIRRMRSGQVQIAGGYDGEYGLIKLFEAHERAGFTPQISLFAPAEKQEKAPPVIQTAEARKTGETATQVSPPGWQQSDLFSQIQETAAHYPAQPQSKSEKSSPPLAGLNPQQQEAVRTTGAPLIIVAGPGTGKTRTLTHRIAALMMEHNVPLDQILAITFTNKAADEMAARLAGLLGPAVAGQLVIKTFHAFGAMLLRESGSALGLSPNFTICSDLDRAALLKQLYPDWREGEVNQALEQISAAKNQLVRPDTEDLTGLKQIYAAYEAALRQNQLVDFDDLVVQPVRLFEAYPELLQNYRQRFRWISVDEYQDINLAQYRLLRLLAGPETNLCVIGDPDQAIYGFRGARREYFLQFRQDFPAAKLLPLSQNYRSTQLILDASSQVIARSQGERVKIWSEFLDKTRLDIYQAPTDKAEAEYVVHQIEQMVGGVSYFSLDSGRVTDAPAAPRSFADFAVLYRLNAQSQLLIEAFERSGIPFQTTGQTSFYELKEVKEMLACLWFIHNRDSSFHLSQNWPAKKIKPLISFLPEAGSQLDSLGVAGLVEAIQQFCLEHGLRDSTETWLERVQQLRRRAVPFEKRLRDFLEATVLQRETDWYDPRADRVTLMTLHASKGLEFPVVFIVGCEEGLLPYRREGKVFDADEERRLFYVGMTRAQHKLILTHAKTRFLFGQRQHPEPSRFLNDIEQALLEIKHMARPKAAPERPESPQLKLF